MGQFSWFKGKPVVKKSALGGKNNKNKDVNMKRAWDGPVKNKTNPGQSTAQLKLARPEKTIYMFNKRENSASTD